MADTNWPQEFESKLRALLPRVALDEPLRPDLNLPDAGLDSLATVNLLIDLEDEYDIRFPDEMLQASTVATPAGLWAAVTALLSQAAGRPSGMP
ncbi:phosphopantetheine-binding protein [Micromonospora sp. RP3T]|uniref:phosphopantetheine-binding protein n=1 Tax=Micromonospora sp. RP3T TaxID=2135446 RepID=UPI003D7370DF